MVYFHFSETLASFFLILASENLGMILFFKSARCTFCSANRGDSLDREIDNENRQTNDFIFLVSLPVILFIRINLKTFSF